ncbi:hypothetical protein COY25_02180 [Candidatus Uhrbacteria bacterium CG_4_10_14_0_2_um_filter_41_7]|nr:MAG: hypothetical protein COY25_02180 [Candidatus Uhrbacteria bacterium CG_4_10_14_0_2_um_filter_41_7]
MMVALKKRVEFTNFSHVKPMEPMNTTEFWQWIDNYSSQSSDFISTLKAYLKNNGFSIKKHILPKEQLEKHKHIHSYYWWKQFDNKQ